MIELARIEGWLFELLTGDATLQALVPDAVLGARVYGYQAPADALYPLVLYRYYDGADVGGLGPARIMVSATYQVKAVGAGESASPLVPIADRLDALLQGASGVVADGAVLTCYREGPESYPEVQEGTGQVTYRHLGGRYRILAQPL